MSQQINLYNPLFRRQKKYFSALTMLQSLSLLLLGALLVYGYAWYRTQQLQARAVQASQTLKATQARLTQAAAQFGPREPSKLLSDEVAAAEARLEARRRIVAMLGRGELGNTQGFSEFFRVLSRQTPEGVWITGFQVSGAGSEMSISGRALRADLVPVFLNRLRIEPALAGKSFTMLEMGLPEAEAAAVGKSAPVPRFIEFSLRKTDLEPAQ